MLVDVNDVDVGGIKSFEERAKDGWRSGVWRWRTGLGGLCRLGGGFEGGFGYTLRGGFGHLDRINVEDKLRGAMMVVLVLCRWDFRGAAILGLMSCKHDQ